MPKLVLPSIKYKKSFVRDFLPHMGKSRVKYESVRLFGGPRDIRNNFSRFVSFLRSQSRGLNLPEGYIPQTVFWLVDGNKMLGWLSLRHKLNDHLKKIGGHIGYEVTQRWRGQGYGRLILKLGLKKARQLGIEEILITCDINNIRSKKVIEGNGGKRLKKFWQPEKKIYKLRYSIKT